MIKISVILSIYSLNFEESLKSILNQTIDEIEIICINFTKSNISNLLKKHDYKQITVLNQQKSENILNKSIQIAKGKYLAFLDAPNYFFEKDALSKMYNSVEERNSIMIGSNYKILNDLFNTEDSEDVNFNEKFEDDLISIPPEEYKINTPIQTNIIKKSFLEENDIQFSNSDIRLEKLFFAKILSKLEEIIISNSSLYCKKLSTECYKYLELNSLEKKENYIKQYENIFEIFKENELLREYKKEFINYLSFKENIYNEDVVKIITEHKIDNFFNENDYGFIIIDSIINPLKTKNEDYFLIKECLFEQNMLENNYIEVNLLKELGNISKKNNEYNTTRYSMKKLKSMNDINFEKNRGLFYKINQLKKDNDYYLNINKSVLSSNSWKITKPIRLIKKLISR